MLSIIGSSGTASTITAQVAALQKQLARYEKQFQADESVGGGSQGSGAQLLASQITLVETEIAQLDAARGGTLPSSAAAAAAPTNSTLGRNINVNA